MVGACYLLWFAVAGQLQSDSSQVGGVGEGQEGGTGSSSKHILFILRSLVAPRLRAQDEEKEKEEEEEEGEEGRGEWRRHRASLRRNKI